ncbi:MAG: hypothetical protein FWC97_12720, partial [Treponema sp.]|nr:hypothetical protein [Treponema sp.]
VVNGVTVGTFTIEATSASPNPVPEGQGVTSITKLVTYTLNEGFIPYVQNMTANGNAVSGTGNTRTVSLTSGAPGPQNLATAFVFRIPD